MKRLLTILLIGLPTTALAGDFMPPWLRLTPAQQIGSAQASVTSGGVTTTIGTTGGSVAATTPHGQASASVGPGQATAAASVTQGTAHASVSVSGTSVAGAAGNGSMGVSLK
jgi:hypothetical protein